MPVAFKSISHTGYGSRTNTTITAPSGIANDDILLAFLFQGQSGITAPAAPTAPSGFTTLGAMTEQHQGGAFAGILRGWWKRAASEAGDYTFTHSAQSTHGYMACYSGANTTTAIDPAATALSGKGGDAINTATGLTTTADNTMLVFAGSDWGDTANDLTPPTGFDERLDVAPLVYLADDIQAAIGASGNKTMTCNSVSGNPRFAWLVPLVPAPEPPSGHPIWLVTA